MEVWGLTGGMATGKTRVATIFRRLSIPVFDADLCVRKLQAPGGKALIGIKKRFPEMVDERGLNRGALRKKILEDKEILRILEMIIHPLVAQEREKFLQFWRKRGASLVVLDIPLLFETGLEKKCDKILVTMAPLSLRLKRIKERACKGGEKIMTEKEALSLIKRQISDVERKRKADIVFYTVFSHGYLTQKIKKTLSDFYISQKGGCL